MHAETETSFRLTLPSDLEIQMERWLAAPPALVFEAWTRPEHVRQWWGCKAMTMPVCEVDLRVGGTWRFVLEMPDGATYGFRGEYRAIEPPHRLVYTYIFEPIPESEALVTVAFTEENGGTRVVEVCRHQSVDARDGHLGSGMESGAAESYDRLEALLATLQQPQGAR